LAHESFSISEVIPAPPEEIYSAWLDTSAHSAFTGEEATVEPFVGGRHTAFGGYAEGTNLELHPGRRIVQTWRSKDFPDESPDSRVEVTLEETVGGTVVTIFHSELPSGQSERYREGWLRNYLDALKQYFASGAESDGGLGLGDDDDDGEPTAVITQPPPPPPPRKAAAANGAPRHTTRAASPSKKAAARRPAAKAKAKAKAKVKAKGKKTARKARAAARKSPARAMAKAKGGKAKSKASRAGKRRGRR
jgi:uncharacterized protein YndB with AHSA1/START domain